MKKQPQITRETKENLMNSFWNLYSTKGISNVSVCKIAENAHVNRSTFYQYFRDIYDLLNQLENSLLDNLTRDIKENFKEGLPDSLEKLSQNCTDIFLRYGDYLFNLLGSHGDPAFKEKFKNTMQPIFLDIIGLDKDMPYMDYILTFVFSSIINLLTLWYESGKKIPYEELINIIQTLTSIGVLGLTNKKLFAEQR